MKNLLVLVFLIGVGFSSFVYGNIYDDSLNPLNNTIITIEGRFSYQFVAQRANYSIVLPEGTYTIYAYNKQNDAVLYAEQTIHVGDKDQRIDLVLKTDQGYAVVIYAVLVFALFSLFYFFVFRKRQQNYVLDKDSEKVLEMLKFYGNRATQKQLKQDLGFSDSKLSLILSELEHFGYIKKFRRGKGNIIRRIVKNKGN